MKKHHAKKKADNVTYIGKIKAPQVDLQIKQIKPLTTNQQKTFEAFQRNKNLLLHGLAGTGKTFMSLFLALENITKKIWAEKITRTAIVIIGDVIQPKSYEYSKLYDKTFSHGYRKAKKP